MNTDDINHMITRLQTISECCDDNTTHNELRAFKRQTGRFLHDYQHKCPVCPCSITSIPDKTSNEHSKQQMKGTK
jgi:hypothetical protein